MAFFYNSLMDTIRFPTLTVPHSVNRTVKEVSAKECPVVFARAWSLPCLSGVRQPMATKCRGWTTNPMAHVQFIRTLIPKALSATLKSVPLELLTKNVEYNFLLINETSYRASYTVNKWLSSSFLLVYYTFANLLATRGSINFKI